MLDGEAVPTKYGVIICPKCGMARGVETRRKTTTCQCGREIVMKRMKIRFATDSPLELADLVANANASIRGGKQTADHRMPRRSSMPPKVPKRAKAVKDPVQQAYLVACELTRARSEFTVEDLRRVASRLGKASPENALERLKRRNLVYEVREGTYRAV